MMRRFPRSVFLSALAVASAAFGVGGLALAQTSPMGGEESLIGPVAGPAAALAGLSSLVALMAMAVMIWLALRLRSNADRLRLLESEQDRFNEILAASPDGFYRWTLYSDNSVAAEECSRRLAVLLGLFGGTNAAFADILECFGKDDADQLDRAVSQLREFGVGFEFEMSLRDANRRVLILGTRAAGGDGEPLADLVWMRDVTEAATTFDRLASDSESLRGDLERLRALLESLPLPVWLRDGDLTLVACNQAYARAVDASSPAAAIETAAELVPGAAMREARALAAHARAAGTARSERYHLVIGGARRLIELTETPLPGIGGGGLMTAGVAIDRTHEEDLQSQVERHVATHAEVLENLGTAIAIFSSDTRLAFFNMAYSMLWRLDADWLATKPTYANIIDILRENRRLPEVADFRAYKDEELRRFTSMLEAKEDLLHLPDERTLRRVVSAHPFGGLLFTYEDVTDALALERSHKTSLAVHRETLNNLHEGIAVFSSDGRLRLHNPAYARIWRLKPEDLADEPHIASIVAHHHEFFTAAGDWPVVRDSIIELFSERVPKHGRIERSDGSCLDYASVPLPDGAILTTWLNVSDSVRVERALRERNEALAAADRLKSEFIANVSAEVRTPLTTILGFSEIMSEGYYGTLNSRQAEYARGINNAGHTLLQVISDILDLANIEAGQMTLTLNAMDIHSMLASVLQLTRERLREKQLVMNFDCPLDIGWIVADERRMRQVLFNLLSNAVKFTPAHGQITLAATRMKGVSAEEVVFTVADTGQGIPPDEHHRVFGSFVRGGRNDPHKTGAGLGLSLVKNFVELHGGWIEFASVPGEGTSFFIHLPVGGDDQP